MTFHNILFERTEGRLKRETLEVPAFFVDLNLDQMIDAITAGRQEYNLKPFFYTSLNDRDTITYRHEVMRDLENDRLFESIRSFAQTMRAMREHLAAEMEKKDLGAQAGQTGQRLPPRQNCSMPITGEHWP